MKLTDLNGKKVCILGFGREGQAMLDAIEKNEIQCDVTVADKNAEAIAKIQDASYPPSPAGYGRASKKQSSDHWLDGLENFDVVIKSPGIPPSHIPNFKLQTSNFTSSTQLFLDTISDRGAIVIGVTGSKGKSTTSSLIYAILKKAGKDVLLLGNIGEPAIAHLDDIKKDTIVVMEMSSYQLSDLTVSPHIAVITSFFPDHLDYHGSLDAYMDAKKNITRHQHSDDIVFFNAHNADTAEIAKEGNGRKIPFSVEDTPITIEETRLIGAHNLSNIAAALGVADALKIAEKKSIEAVKEFNGLPHRLEFVGTFAKISWVDDAISTTPESTIAAISALDDRASTIILGGMDRGYDFEQLGVCIAASSIKTVILFPGSGPKIKQAIEAAHAQVQFYDAADMEVACRIAKEHTAEDSIVLLSTASPSYGMFKNFEEKGDEFKKLIGLLVS